MKKIIAIAILVSFFSCSSYQKMFLDPVNRHNLLEDSCDVLVINQLKRVFDTMRYDKTLNQTLAIEDLIEISDCEYYANRIYNPLLEDSSIWLLTIRPVLVGEDEIILGNLYTFYPKQDSTFTFYRRVKEYSQKEEFESGKYVVFTYFVENDSTTIIKAGKKRF